MTVRVLIADDHPLVRQGLQAALAPLPEVDVVAEVGGTLEVGPTPTGGRVQAHLPLELA